MAMVMKDCGELQQFVSRAEAVAAKVTRVVFDMIHDENVEIYLNGTRILEEAGSNDRWEPFEIPVETFTSAVREGDNVLAVKVHDNGAPRYFDCGLTVEVEESK